MDYTKNYGDSKLSDLQKLSKDQLIKLIIIGAKNWLAHDGLWFQAVEKKRGIDEAIKADGEAWRKFSPIEAKRIMEFLNIKPNGGLDALKIALQYRMYAHLNKQEIIDVDENTIIFRMNDCRVQSARKRKNLPDFPCKSVGIIEYEEFAKTIDPRIRTKCIACPPDNHPDDFFCAWEFTI
ncbi:MAG: hypothetical protein EAX96_12445 [Candidatus Lokiarchaeota archaeon]|nr:hypothetical protein [Candidatus Lokiarchaeota archaeon]